MYLYKAKSRFLALRDKIEAINNSRALWELKRHAKIREREKFQWDIGDKDEILAREDRDWEQSRWVETWTQQKGW